jgi:uncharacterized membrane protein YfcA
MEDPSVRAIVVAVVSGVVGAVVGFAVARESIDVGVAIVLWAISTVVALAYLGVAAEGRVEYEPDPIMRAINGVLSTYGFAALIGGAVGGVLGAASGSPNEHE